MNAWGFKRLYQSGPDLGCHYHECFLRGLPKLTCLIRRLPPSLGKAAPYPAGEPNFYTISAKFPLPFSDAAGSITLRHPSSNVFVRRPEGSPAAEEVARRMSTLDPPSHDQSQSETIHSTSSLMQTSTQAYFPGLQLEPSVFTPTQLQELSNQDSTSAFASVALEDVLPRRGQSTEVLYPSFSLPQEPTAALAASARMTYESPHQMSHYTQDYQYPQPQDQTSHSYASSTPTNHMLPLEHYGRHYDSTYDQYSTQSQNPQYQYQIPQYTFQHQPYERPRFRYPPPQIPQHLNFTPGSVAPTGGRLPQGSYHHYHGSNLNTGQSLPPSPRIRGSHERDATSSEWPLMNANDSSLITEPLPYAPRSREETPNKKRKPDPPP